MFLQQEIKAIRGDHYVTLVVNTPTGLSKDAKEALKKFDELSGGSLTKEGGASTDSKKKKDLWISSRSLWTICK